NFVASIAGASASLVVSAPLQDGSKTVVIKHTEGYDYEQTVLVALLSLLPSTHSNITVQTPTLHIFLPATNTQIYSDLSSSLDLKAYVLKHASSITHSQCLRLGHALGLWTRRFHDWAQAKEQEELVESMRGNVAMRDLKFMINYERLVQSIDTYPRILEGSRSLFEAVREGVRKDLDDGAVLIHGDLWSGNILLPDGPISDQDDQLKVFVIDWELSQVSSQAFDLGQVFAELFELKHFKDIDAGTWLIEAFMRGYGEIDEELAFKTAVHISTLYATSAVAPFVWISGTPEDFEPQTFINSSQNDYINGAMQPQMTQPSSLASSDQPKSLNTHFYPSTGGLLGHNIEARYQSVRESRQDSLQPDWSLYSSRLDEHHNAQRKSSMASQSMPDLSWPPLGLKF
ncbi:hypothetical protein D6C97_09750, partial [Aureobasidium pullulans]